MEKQGRESAVPQREQCVCFTGHRELEEAELPGLRQALEQAGEQANADQVLEFVKQAAPAAFGEQLVRCVKNYL